MLQKNILLAILTTAFTFSANAVGVVSYCAPTAVAAAKAIAKINNPGLTKQALKKVSVEVLDPETGNQFDVTINGTLKFEVTTTAMDGDCLVGKVLMTE